MSIRAKTAIAAIAVVGALGAMTVHSIAQHRDEHGRYVPDQRRLPLSPEDRAAFFDARLAALHAGLRLSADQEKLWSPVEAAARDKAKIMMELGDKNRNAGRPQNPIEGLRRRGETESARGLADTKLADAAQPLWNTLTDQQKHRFERLTHRLIADNRHDRHDDNRGGPRGHDEREKHRGAGKPFEDFAPPPVSRPAPPPR